MLDLTRYLTIDQALIDEKNLCHYFDDKDTTAIAAQIYRGYEMDKESRSQWEVRMEAAMNLAMQVAVAKNFPWPNCSNVVFPLVTIAALQFSARSYAAIIQGNNVVRYKTVNGADKLAVDRAKRIGKHMSWQVLEEDEAWEEQHDRLLINLSIVGCNFIKSYYDANKAHTIGVLVMAKDLIIDYFAESVDAAARVTHRFSLSRNAMRERMLRGTFVDCTEEAWFRSVPAQSQTQAQIDSDRRLGKSPPLGDKDTPFFVLEQHCWLDLDGDGYAEPYIVTIEESSKTLLRIVARFERMEDIEFTDDDKILCIHATQYFTKYSFIPSPDGGIYDLGFGVFLGPINEAVNSAINQMLDFGTMQNSLGGLLGRGAKIRGGVYTMAPWEFKRVDSSGDDLRKNVFMWPDRAPPTFLFQLIELLIEYSNRLAGTVDATVGENPGQNTPAGTFQGMTEMGMQVYKMIFKRVWRSMKEEFKQRFTLNRIYLPRSAKFGSGEEVIRREDYIAAAADLIAPVANPNVSSVIMRLQTAMAVKQAAAGTPGYDISEVEKVWLDNLEVENVDVIYPGPGKVPQANQAPNPKAAVEQMKLQGIQMKLEAEKMKWANHLMEEQRLNTAKIRLIEAQAMKAASEAHGAQAALQIEAFEQLLKMHEQLGDQMNKQISTLLGEGDGSENSDGGGVSQSQSKSGDESDSSVSVSVPGGSKVSVGDGAAK
jgi:chaperonin GroES